MRKSTTKGALIAAALVAVGAIFSEKIKEKVPMLNDIAK